MYYLVTFGGIHENFWQENLKTRGGIHDSRSTPALEPSRVAKWFQFIFILHFMKPLWFQDF